MEREGRCTKGNDIKEIFQLFNLDVSITKVVDGGERCDYIGQNPKKQ